MKHALRLSVVFATACGPTVMPPADETGSTATTGPGTTGQVSATTTADDTGPPDDDTGPPPTGPTDSTDPTDPTDSTGGVTSGGFIDDPDGGGAATECDLWAQDCPPGEKCVPWANDGGNAWNASRCSPVADNPGQAGDPCTVEGSATSGIDTCELGAMCWQVDSDTGEGTCRDLCVGSESAAVCEDPDTFCFMGADTALIVCVPRCDPVSQDCPDGDGCYPLSGGFLCVPSGGGDESGPGASCEFINVCDPGYFCGNPSVNTTTCLDQGAPGCCLPFCHVDMPQCPNEEVCLPWFEAGDPDGIGYEHVGFCSTD